MCGANCRPQRTLHTSCLALAQKHWVRAATPLPAAPDGGFTAHGYSQEIRMLIGSGIKGQGGTALVYKSTSLLSGVLKKKQKHLAGVRCVEKINKNTSLLSGVLEHLPAAMCVEMDRRLQQPLARECLGPGFARGRVAALWCAVPPPAMW